MRPVRIQRAKLLDTIRTNREHHHGIFTEALDGYMKMAQTQLNEQLAIVAAGKPPKSVAIILHRPEDHTRDYDAAISMLEMTDDPVIEIDEPTFRELVLDDWKWKQAWSISNSAYSSTLAREVQAEEYL